MNLIKKHEGLELTAYFDAVGVPTIGWGHTSTVTEQDVENKKTITIQEAQRLFDLDVKAASWAATAVTGMTSGPIHTAITSFVFNLGPDALNGKSTRIAYHLVNKNYNKAYLGMQRYVYAGGRKLRGLTKRRKEEGELLLQGARNLGIHK